MKRGNVEEFYFLFFAVIDSIQKRVSCKIVVSFLFENAVFVEFR